MGTITQDPKESIIMTEDDVISYATKAGISMATACTHVDQLMRFAEQVRMHKENQETKEINPQDIPARFLTTL